METLTIYHVVIEPQLVDFFKPTHQTHIKELYNISS
jgi:hypothetical protein